MDKDSPASYKSPYSKYPYTKPVRERYLTAFEREQFAKEKMQRDEERRKRQFKQSSGTEKGEEKLQKDSSYVGQKTGDDQQTISPPFPSNVTAPPSVLPTPPTSASITDRSPTPREIDFGDNIDASSKLRVDTAHYQLSPRSSTVDEKASVGAIVDLPGASPRTDGMGDVQVAREGDSPTWKAFNDIPGIWLLKQGSSEPDVVEESFEVTKEICKKWQIPLADEESFVPHQSETLLELLQASSPKLSWQLKCIPIHLADPVQQFSDNTKTSRELVRVLSQLQSQWPPAGKLIIELNPDHNLGETLYATHLVNLFASNLNG
jgi:hypothetical protein